MVNTAYLQGNVNVIHHQTTVQLRLNEWQTEPDCEEKLNMVSEPMVQEADARMDNAAVYASLGVASALYAAYLNTSVGKEFSDRYTWASVTLGTAIVLAAARLLMPARMWNRLVVAFAVAGSPMVLRSLYNRFAQGEE